MPKHQASTLQEEEMVRRDRRTFLACAVAGLTVASTACAHARRPAEPRVGIADITVHTDLQQDYQRTVAALRKIGFTHLGTRQRRWSPHDREEPSAAEKARIFKAEGMLPGPARMVPGMALGQQIEETLVIGSDILVMSVGSIFHDHGEPRTPSPSEFDRFIAELNEMGSKCRAAGIKLAYHNHDYDAVLVEGKRAYDRMIDETDPSNLFFEVDLAWAHVNGDDPIGLAQRLGDRLVSLHIKDYDPKKGPTHLARMAVPGEGEIDFVRLLPPLMKVTNALPLLEAEGAGGTPVGMAAARRGYEYLARILHRL